MGWKDVAKTFTSYLTGEALAEAADQIEQTVDHTTAKVIKASTLYVMFIIGMLFFLIGLSQYLQVHNGWTDGLGFAIVGAAIIFIGVVAKALR